MSALSRAAMAAALFIASFAGATGAPAVPNRTAVSVSGTDSGNCAPATPCRSIAYALTQTTQGGEMFVLTSGGYGPFTVTQSVSIIAPTGVIAAISAGSGDGITVNAGAGDVVLLEGFLIDGLGTGTNGITVNSAQTVTLIGSKITGFEGEGLSFTPMVSEGTTKLAISNSMIYGNRAGSLFVRPSGSTTNGLVAASVLVEDSTFTRSPITFDGSSVTGQVHAVLDNCVVRNIPVGVNGVVVNASTGATAVQFLRSTMLTVATGFVANGSGAHIAIGNSGLSDLMTVATATGGGQVGSYGNNNLSFYNTLGPLTTITQH